MAEFIQPLKAKPGKFFIPALGKVISIVEWREGDLYDSVAMTGALGAAATTTFTFFRDLQGKDVIDANITTPNKIPAGDEALVNRIGVYVHLAVGQVVPIGMDIKKIYECGYFVFRVNRKLVAEGPALFFPSGYGLAGQTQEGNQCVISNGVASTAAAMNLAKIQELTNEHDLNATLQFLPRGWIPIATIPAVNQLPTLVNACVVKAMLHGMIKSQATR